ncbi:hypothetical protein [Desulfocicer vacuolatum]|uniref:hypothetical protein n=1 Tax=Desulfocicer vacuolatum TaxID=2298 RepID=UPI00111C1F75|nr:hypothetical protein [Desulfocicer vacuolatum]
MRCTTIIKNMLMPIIAIIINGNTPNIPDTGKDIRAIAENTVAGTNIKKGDTWSWKKSGWDPFIETNGNRAIITDGADGLKGTTNKSSSGKDIGKKDRCGHGVIDNPYRISLVI